jgi:hypothetical protein
MAIIVASALGTLGFGAVLAMAMALGRAAAIADEQAELAHAERRVTPSIAAGYRQSYLQPTVCWGRDERGDAHAGGGAAGPPGLPVRLELPGG